MHLKLLAKKILSSLFYAVILVGFTWSQGAFSYVKFSNKPVEAWGDLFVQSGSEKFYTVERGDTLYDISRTLFGDPDFWPKIWSLNSKITNPHIIEKGQVIYFVGGTSYRAPKVGMAILQPDSYTYGNHFLSPEIPPEGLTKGPIKIPGSFPNLLRSMDASAEVQIVKDIKTSKRAARGAARVIEITSEVSNTKPVSVGKVERVFSSAEYAVVGDLLYLKVYSGVDIGDILSVYRTRNSWFPLRKLLPLRANMVEWIGKVQITSTAEEGYVARVVHANELIPMNSQLALREIKTIALPNDVSKQDLKPSIDANAQIIGAHKIAGSTVVGENQIVYLNSGAAAGIETGGVYPLYTNFGESGISKPKRFVPKRIGYVKIASVENSVSTGVAFNLISEVQVDQAIGL